MEKDWACAVITSRQPCKNSPNMDSGGKEKAGTAKGAVEKNCGQRGEISGIGDHDRGITGMTPL